MTTQTTDTRIVREKLPYATALACADRALKPYLGRDIGHGWVFNGGVPYVTAKGKLLYNLTITPSRYVNEVEEAEMFHIGGMADTIEFLKTLDLLGVAHFVVGQDERDLAERLRAL